MLLLNWLEEKKNPHAFSAVYSIYMFLYPGFLFIAFAWVELTIDGDDKTVFATLCEKWLALVIHMATPIQEVVPPSTR